MSQRIPSAQVRKPKLGRTLPSAFFAFCAVLLVVGNSAQPAVGAAAPAVPVKKAVGANVTRSGLDGLTAVSFNGRAALGDVGMRDALWRISARPEVRTLPNTDDDAYEYVGLSGGGDLVAFQRLAKLGRCPTYQPKVRNPTPRSSKYVATAKSGKRLQPGWRAKSCSAEDDFMISVEDMPTFSAPALAGDGRHVAFCANLARPDRIDLYLKDLKSGSIRVLKGVCQKWSDPDEEYPGSRIMDPQISFDGRVVLLPGPGPADGSAPAKSFRLVVDRAEVRDQVIGERPQLVPDGSAVYASHGIGCSPDGTDCQTEGIRYDVATGTSAIVPADEPAQVPMSRNGRFALQADSHTLRVYDRKGDAWTDLSAAFTAAGVEVQAAEAFISGDGKLVFARSTANDVYYSLRWRT